VRLTRRELAGVALAAAAPAQTSRELDPRGVIHIPIGIPNTVDTLKTFVEAEGAFSPGVGTFGVYVWIFLDGRLHIATNPQRGLRGNGMPIPWVRWRAAEAEVEITVAEAQREGAFFTAALVHLRTPTKARVYAALRGLGPAGGEVRRLEVGAAGSALLIGGHTALVGSSPSRAGVLATDTVGELAMRALVPTQFEAESRSGDCSGALVWDVGSGEHNIELICPVLAGRYAVGHRWADAKQNAMVDVAELDSPDEGVLQPDIALRPRATAVISEAEAYWNGFFGDFEARMPDPRWGEGLRAMLAHAALAMNNGAPDVAVVNYNVFNRDGVYVASMLQKAGQWKLAAEALDYFMQHPFNGRAYPEADNPGQVLWALGEQWLITRDREWLAHSYGTARQLARMIEYYRTTPGPHRVSMRGIGFGPGEPHELKPGRCDGFHPEYTEAFDIAGLRHAGGLAEATGRAAEAARWRALADRLSAEYDKKFGVALPRQYGSYAVLWPCRLYPRLTGKAHEQFRSIGPQKPAGWRYFPLATAHQGLLAGNRSAAHGTIAIHLDHPQMQHWYAFDEGGGSGTGGWHRTRTTWPHSKDKPGANLSVAMPHGWAIAEMWLLMRDSVVFEDDGALVLFAGIAPEWFRDPRGMGIAGWRTHYGSLSLEWRPGSLRIGGDADPPRGFRLMLPDQTVELPRGSRDWRS
jgi:hypothetical protein